MGTDLVKQNINFMENPIWVLSKYPSKELTINNERGEYHLRSGYKLPEKKDIDFMLYFLLMSQKRKYVKTLEFTRYEVLKDCGMNVSEKDYQRLEDSLERWKHTGIKFKGTFYDDKEYLVRSFNVLNGYLIDKKTKKLKVKLNEDFLLMMKNSNFCKYIDFKQYTKLKRPVSGRLYEILLKTFKDRNEWEIEAINLAEKLTLGREGKKKLYPADIKIKLIPGINEINKKTELKIEMKTRKNKQKQTIFTFKLLKNAVIEQKEQDNSKIEELISLLKEEYRESKSLKTSIQKYYKEFDYDYVKYNIAYANLKAVKSYIGFLRNALKNNWGDELKTKEQHRQVEETFKRLEKEEKAKKEQEENQKAEKEYQEKLKICEFVNSLNKQDKERFINDILDNLKNKNDYSMTKKLIKTSKELSVATVLLYSDVFKSCYDNYTKTA